MIRKEKAERGQMEFVCLENMVPEDHLLRKIETAVDFDKIYDIVEELYSADNGRPSTDPVVLFKMVLIQHLYGIPSLRKTAEEVRMNIKKRLSVSLPMRKKNTECVIQIIEVFPKSRNG